jgi:lysylphosphatidylglycerol synthetase-like protein (DUF2156 family)
MKKIYFDLHEDRCIVDYVQRWGHPTSIALLDPSCEIFSTPDIEGIIGYRTQSNNAIVFGDPVCSLENIPKLTRAFHNYCKKIGTGIIYVASSERFVNWALPSICRSAIGFGDEIILNPLINPLSLKGKGPSLLRNKFNQSVREGITVREYKEPNISVEQSIEQVGIAWQKSRQGPQIYLHQINIFKDRSNKRWFYAEYQNGIIGVLMLNRIDAYNGWVINILMVQPEAPSYTSELLILSALDALRAEQCDYLSIGTTPAAQLGAINGLSAFSTWCARKTFNIAKRFFKLGDRQRYWKKFHPRTSPSYLLFSKPRIGISEILCIMRALNAPV